MISCVDDLLFGGLGVSGACVSEGSGGDELVFCIPGWRATLRRSSGEFFEGLTRSGVSSLREERSGELREPRTEELEYKRGVRGRLSSAKLTLTREERRDTDGAGSSLDASPVLLARPCLQGAVSGCRMLTSWL